MKCGWKKVTCISTEQRTMTKSKKYPNRLQRSLNIFQVLWRARQRNEADRIVGLPIVIFIDKTEEANKYRIMRYRFTRNSRRCCRCAISFLLPMKFHALVYLCCIKLRQKSDQRCLRVFRLFISFNRNKNRAKEQIFGRRKRGRDKRSERKTID